MSSAADVSSSKEYRASDTMLVRIAERPLVVAALFLLTALFPWLVYYLVPVLSRAPLLDLIQWLQLPVLFLAVNGGLFVLWINYHGKSRNSSSSSSSGGAINRSQSRDWNEAFDDFKKPNPAAAAAAKEEEEEGSDHDHSSSSSSTCSSESESEAEEKQELRVNKLDPKIEEAPTAAPAHAASAPAGVGGGGGGGGGVAGGGGGELEREIFNSGHSKTQSLRENLKLDPSFFGDFQKPGKVGRRSKTPKRSSLGPRSLRTLDPDHVTRMNSSPKIITPEPEPPAMRFEERTASLHGDSSSAPPTSRTVDSRSDPIPLDKDELNDRIENFLHKFKIKRQESNLRAALQHHQ